MSEDLTGPPPIDDKSIEEESVWIYNQLTADSMYSDNQVIKDISKGDIRNVLTMLHVQKFDVRIFVGNNKFNACYFYLDKY